MCNFLQKNDPRFIKILFCRFWAKENLSTQLKIWKPYVALIYHFKGLFSTIHCQFSWHQSNKNSTQFYSQFRNFFPINMLYKIFQIFNQKKSWKLPFTEKSHNFEILWGSNNFWTFAYIALKIGFCVYFIILNKYNQVLEDLKFSPIYIFIYIYISYRIGYIPLCR